MLGLIYATGQGVAKDDAEAARWYRMAAELGMAEAQFNLGIELRQWEGSNQGRG